MRGVCHASQRNGLVIEPRRSTKWQGDLRQIKTSVRRMPGIGRPTKTKLMRCTEQLMHRNANMTCTAHEQVTEGASAESRNALLHQCEVLNLVQ